MRRERVSDFLLIEDLEPTVAGLRLDLEARGASVFLATTVVRARRLIVEETWSCILFDLRLPYERDEVPTVEVGVRLLKEYVSGDLGDPVPFGVITLQTETPEIEFLQDAPDYLGVFTKRQDLRSLFALLRSKGILDKSWLDSESELAVDRRSVSMTVVSVDASSATVTLVANEWGEDEVRVSLFAFVGSARQRLLAGERGMVKGVVNVNAEISAELEPSDLSFEDSPLAEDYRGSSGFRV